MKTARRSRWAHRLTQNVGLMLATLMLAASIAVYCAIFYAQQQTLPGLFELTSTVNNTMPLVVAGLAQAHGIAVRRTKVLAYVLGGTLSAAAGLFLAATATAGDATTGNGFTLTSIVAAVLGGVSLFGGHGSGIGAMLGAFVINMIVNILFFAHIDPLYQAFYEGLFLVIAVVLASGIGTLIRRRR